MRIGDKAVHISDVSPTLHHGIEEKCEHGHVWYSTVRVFCVEAEGERRPGWCGLHRKGEKCG